MRMVSFPLMAFALLVPMQAKGLEQVFGNGNLVITTHQNGLTFGAHNAWAIPFTTGATSSTDQLKLTGVWVLVGGQSSATFSASIYADGGTLQGPSGGALATGTLSNVSSAYDWRYVSFLSPITLVTSGRYYLSVELGSTFAGFNWAEPVDRTDPLPVVSTTYTNLGSGSDYQITGSPATSLIWQRIGSTWGASVDTVDSTPMGMQLQGVPEPSTWVMGLVGALGLAACRKRSLRRT